MCINLIECCLCEPSFLLSKTRPTFFVPLSPPRVPLLFEKSSYNNRRGKITPLTILYSSLRFGDSFHNQNKKVQISQRRKEKMKQNGFAAYEGRRASVAVSVPRSIVPDFTTHGRDRERETVVCPKPRRIGGFNPAMADPIRQLRRHVSHQQEVCDAKAGAELLDIILAKGGYGTEQSSCTQAASSPPFFSGSPPSRVSNPLIQDARFGDEKVTPISPRAIPIPSGLASSPSSSARKAGGCVRANFGNNPAVRIEGFDCLDRDRRNCSIPALA